MDLEPTGVSEEVIGSLKSCLVEGDPEQQQRERKTRRRAVALSIAIQSAVVAALVLFPLLSKGEHIAVKVVTPLPPFNRGTVHAQNTATQNNHHSLTPVCRFCAPPSVPNHIVTHDPPGANEPGSDPIPGAGSGPVGDPNGVPFSSPNSDKGPVKPLDDGARKNTLPRISVGHIEPALLTHRVEPLYPPLARQLRREGRVELRAIISTDGSIQSLEAISGDPFFFQSALEAVRQWRYRATILDGHSVEVDTHITVIYTLNH